MASYVPPRPSNRADEPEPTTAAGSGGGGARRPVRSKPYVVLAGNPGTGKSTILNGLIGEYAFKSGVSLGQGMTMALQLFETTDCFYGDTPGLADAKIKEQAAAEIHNLFKKCLNDGGQLKLIFVVTLEAGRVKPADVVTMNLILASISSQTEIANHFGILVNKVSNGVIAQLEKDPAGLAKVQECLQGNFRTGHLYINKIDMDLFDIDDVVKPLDEGVRQFIESVPPVYLEAVTDINLDEFAALQKEMDARIQEMMKANAEMVQDMREQQQIDRQTAAAAMERQAERNREELREQREFFLAELEQQRQLESERYQRDLKNAEQQRKQDREDRAAMEAKYAEMRKEDVDRHKAEAEAAELRYQRDMERLNAERTENDRRFQQQRNEDNARHEREMAKVAAASNFQPSGPRLVPVPCVIM
jgi:GTP-binding protein EngB required for normal cell division